MTTRRTQGLRTLYLTRFIFAIVWAVAVIVAGPDIAPLTTALLLIYPAVDLAAALVDYLLTRQPILIVNMVLSVATVIALAVSAGMAVDAVFVVWGAWAITAGAVQLAVALTRRRSLGGQGAMIVSGSLSVLAGVAFELMAATMTPMLVGLAGYAALGGTFFLISAIRLGRLMPHQSGQSTPVR